MRIMYLRLLLLFFKVDATQYECYHQCMILKKEILKKYPELKPPASTPWIIPSIILIIAILAWSSHDTELVSLKRKDGKVDLIMMGFRLPAAQNIVFGLERKTLTEIDGRMVETTRRTGGLIRPDFSQKTLDTLIPNMLVTIEMALLGTLIGFIFAFPMCFLAARNIIGTNPTSLFIYGATRFLFNFLSAIPTLIVALVFTVIVGMGPAAGVLALAFNSIGMLGRMFAEALENVDRGPIEALQATGAGWVQTVVYGVLPQISPLFLAYSIYRWDINVRMSMVLGFVGAGGIGVFLNQHMNLFNYSQVSTAFILILIVVTLLDWGNSLLQRKVL